MDERINTRLWVGAAERVGRQAPAWLGWNHVFSGLDGMRTTFLIKWFESEVCEAKARGLGIVLFRWQKFRKEGPLSRRRS